MRNASRVVLSLSVLLAVALLAVVVPPVGAGPGASVERHRVVVGYEAGVTAAQVAVRAQAEGLRPVRDLPALSAMVLEAPDLAAAVQAARRLAATAGIRYAEPDRPVDVGQASQITPGDPLWLHQWGLRTGRFPEAWTGGVGDEAVIIAVLDTGVDLEHPDLAGKITGGANFTEPGQPPSDRNGHGTMSAGVAAASTDNGAGVAGACWRCRIMPVKVLGDDGSGVMSNVASGILWATDNGAAVINLSLGGPLESRLVRDAIGYATTREVVLVASAGNEATTTPFYPAADPRVIGVAGSTEADGRYDWSNFGDWVDVAAPGCNPSTSLAGLYGWFCGTSSAGPMVAGLAGLLRSSGTVTAAAVHSAITATAVPVDFVSHGRLDAAAAMLAAPPSPDEPAVPPPPSMTEPMPAPTVPEEEEEASDPVAGTTVERVAGVDRYATAVAVSERVFAPGVARVYIATGERFPDALAAGAAAAAFSAPVLAVPSSGLPGPVAQELDRLRPAEVVIVGGEAAVPGAVQDEIAAAAGAPVRRVAGADRYATAAAVALDAFPGGAETVYVATGEHFADALAAVPAAGAEDAPLLLTGRDQLPAATDTALAQLSPARIVLLGGPGAVGQEVAAVLEGRADSVVRLHGPNRFATAAAIAAAVFGPDGESTYLGTGAAFPDALAGGAAAAAEVVPLLLVAPDQLPAATADQLRALRPDMLVILGGRSAVSSPVAQEAAEVAAEAQPT